MRILHISDAHFGLKENRDNNNHINFESTHYFIDKHKKPDPSVILKLIKNKYSHDYFDLIIDSGDIGWSGIQSEYKYAFPLYKGFKEYFTTAEIVIVPGNHDVNLKDPNNERKQDDFVEFLKEFYGIKFKFFFPFYKQNDRHSLVFFYYIQDKFLVVGVNSAANICDYMSQIYISPNILNEIGESIIKLNSVNTLKIFVTHHHLLPFVEPKWDNIVEIDSVKEKIDNSLTINSARVQSWLGENNFHLVLHGHKHLFHGREDLLWHDRLYDNEQRKLILLGAGSIGVKDDSRRPSPICFNTIKVFRKDNRDYRFSINVNAIKEKATNYIIEEWIHKNCSSSSNRLVNEFEGITTAECHEQIFLDISHNEKVYNFVSIVHNSNFELPKTCTINNKTVNIEVVKNAFYSLHPEYDNLLSKGWKDPLKIKKTLQNNNKRYNIDHGTRMFGITEIFNLAEIENSKIDEYFPINKALYNLKNSESRGFVGLYNFDMDVKRDNSALPGLTGIQFVPRKENGMTKLDLVAFFRNLELSFWWVVNCYEMYQLQEYAIRKLGNKYKSGKIVFFASMAEWNTHSIKAPMKPEIELITKDKIYDIVTNLANENLTSIKKTLYLFEDYFINLNDINIYLNNIEEMRYMLLGIEEKSDFVNSLYLNILELCQILENAIEDKNKRNENILDAKENITKLVKLLKGKISAANSSFA